MATSERAPLLPTHAAPPSTSGASSQGVFWSRRWSLQCTVLVAFIVLSAAMSLALVRVSLLSSELLASLHQLQPAQSEVRSHSASSEVPTHAAVDLAFAASPSSARVLIVYSNGTHLSKLAAAVERGVRQQIAQPEQLRTRLVEDASFQDDVLWADAVVLGSHVVNANVEPKMAAFMSRWVFSEDLSHKVGAAFVTGGGLSAGEELTMVNVLHSMLIFRMVIVGGERWTSAFGASAIVSEGPFQPAPEAGSTVSDFPPNCYPSSADDVHAIFEEKAQGLGRRVASVASLLVAARTGS